MCAILALWIKFAPDDAFQCTFKKTTKRSAFVFSVYWNIGLVIWQGNLVERINQRKPQKSKESAFYSLMDHKRRISGLDPDEKAQEGCSPMAKKDALVYNSRNSYKKIYINIYVNIYIKEMFSGISQKTVKHHLCHCFARGSVQGQLLIQLYDEPDFFFLIHF